MTFVEADEISADDYMHNVEKVAGRRLAPDERERFLEVMGRRLSTCQTSTMSVISKFGSRWPLWWGSPTFSPMITVMLWLSFKMSVRLWNENINIG